MEELYLFIAYLFTGLFIIRHSKIEAFVETKTQCSQKWHRQGVKGQDAEKAAVAQIAAGYNRNPPRQKGPRDPTLDKPQKKKERKLKPSQSSADQRLKNRSHSMTILLPGINTV